MIIRNRCPETAGLLTSRASGSILRLSVPIRGQASLQPPRAPRPHPALDSARPRVVCQRAPQLLHTALSLARLIDQHLSGSAGSRAAVHPQRNDFTARFSTAARPSTKPPSTTTPTVRRHNQHNQPVRRTAPTPLGSDARLRPSPLDLQARAPGGAPGVAGPPPHEAGSRPRSRGSYLCDR